MFKFIDLISVNGDRHGIVMEYIKGKTLFDLAKEGNLSEQKILKYIRDIAKGLMFLHQKSEKILHRDVKPENIMVEKSTDNAILIDFGSSRTAGINNTISYTEGYTPIEQYYSLESQGDYTDVYSLAATLYVLITNHYLSNALDREKRMIKNKVDSLIPPQNFNSAISDELNDAILKGLELYPQNRPQTIAEWLQLLPQNTKNIGKNNSNKNIINNSVTLNTDNV